jgi:hypothetical protein
MGKMFSDRGHIDSGNRTPSKQKKASLPQDLSTGTPLEYKTLGRLRNVSNEAVSILASRGLIGFGTFKGQQSWFVFDGSKRNVQARRMDGGKWESIGGKKAHTLRGYQSTWPIGTQEAKQYNAIALVEGGPDLLAAMHFALAEVKADRVAPVCITGSHPLPDDFVREIEGKRVRIFAHRDEAGKKAAYTRHRQLKSMGASADIFIFEGLIKRDGSQVQDLNDLTYLHPDQFESDRELWEIMP